MIPAPKPMPVGQLLDELAKHPRDALVTHLELQADYPGGPDDGHVQIGLHSIIEWGNAKTCPIDCRCRQPRSEREQGDG